MFLFSGQDVLAPRAVHEIEDSRSPWNLAGSKLCLIVLADSDAGKDNLCGLVRTELKRRAMLGLNSILQLLRLHVRFAKEPHGTCVGNTCRATRECDHLRVHEGFEEPWPVPFCCKVNWNTSSILGEDAPAKNKGDTVSAASLTKAVHEAARQGHVLYAKDGEQAVGSEPKVRKFWLTFVPPRVETVSAVVCSVESEAYTVLIKTRNVFNGMQP